MIDKLKNYPIIPLTIFFIVGILFQYFFVINILILLLITIVIFILSLIIFFQKIFNPHPFILTSLIIILSFLLGGIIYQIHNQNKPQYPFTENLMKDVNIYGRIESIELKSKNEIKFNLNVDSLNAKNNFIRGEFNFICRIRDESVRNINQLYDKLNPGNYVSLEGFYTKGKNQRNPNEFDYRNYLYKNGITGIVYVSSINDIKILEPNKNHIKSIIFNIRKVIDNQIEKLHQQDAEGLLKGLVLGDKSEISYETQAEFINSGVAHVLAVSGQQVGLIALIFIIVFGRFNLYLRTILTIISIFIFLIITGSQPAVLRATIMATVFFVAYLTNRDTNPFNAISIAALLILIFNPNDLFDPSFQLSFGAVLSTIIFYPIMNNELSKLNIKNKNLKLILQLFILSLTAQIGIIPITNIYFGQISIVSLLSNLIVIPGVSLVLANGILTLFVSLLSIQLGLIFAAANDLIVSLLYFIIKVSANFEYSVFQVRYYNEIDALIYYAFIIFVTFFYLKFKNRFAQVLLIIFTILNIFIYSSFNDRDLLPPNKLSVMMIDVGQGDATLIKFPNEKTILIDAGNVTPTFDNGDRVILPLLNTLGIKKIDFGIISNMDNDHYGGFVSLIQKKKIGKIIKSYIDSSLIKDVKFENYLRQTKTSFSYFTDTSFYIGNSKIYFLNNSENLNKQFKSTNDRSCVMMLIYGNHKFLFMGDAEMKMETYLSNLYGNFLDVDVLKVGHHGSITSSTEKYLNYVTPNYSLISVGEMNHFNHPSPIVIERLGKLNSNIYRTDLEGAIILQSDGKEIKKINWRELK